MVVRDFVYSPLVQAYFDNPERSGTLQAPPEERVVGLAGSPEQGAAIEFQLRIIDGRVCDVSYRVYGCPHTIAIAAWVADKAMGLAVAELGGITPKEAAKALDLPVARMRSALLAEDALASCIAQWDSERF